MLRYGDVVALDRRLRDAWVLTVYLGGAPDDPARRRARRAELAHALASAARHDDAAPRAAREAFAQAAAHVEAWAADAPLAPHDHATVVLATPAGIEQVALLPSAVPTAAVWHRGPFIAPWLGAIEGQRPVLVVRIDGKGAVFDRVEDDRVVPVARLEAPVPGGDAPHLGDAPRLGFHPGTRGRTARDAMARARRDVQARLVDDVAARCETEAADGCWVLLGGAERAVHAVGDRLPASLAPRTDRDGPPMGATPAEVVVAAQGAARRLREAAEAARVGAIEDAAHANGRAALGDEETRFALRRGQVDALILTPDYLDQHVDDATAVVQAALDQGARVEVVHGEPAARLARWGGMAAALRYPLAALVIGALAGAPPSA
jgi:hypothetical protein